MATKSEIKNIIQSCIEMQMMVGNKLPSDLAGAVYNWLVEAGVLDAEKS